MTRLEQGEMTILQQYISEHKSPDKVVNKDDQKVFYSNMMCPGEHKSLLC